MEALMVVSHSCRKAKGHNFAKKKKKMAIFFSGNLNKSSLSITDMELYLWALKNLSHLGPTKSLGIKNQVIYLRKLILQFLKTIL